MNDCALFEDRLTALLAGEIADGDDRSVSAMLRQHSGDCQSCARSELWVEFAALPKRLRDPHPDLPGEYWEEFNARVAARLAARAVPPWPLYVAAAVIVVALATGWLARGWFDPAPDESVAGNRESLGWSRLEEVIREATPEELAAALRGLPGGPWAESEPAGSSVDDAVWSGAWMPDTEELDELDRATLIEWLEQQVSTEGRPIS